MLIQLLQTNLWLSKSKEKWFSLNMTPQQPAIIGFRRYPEKKHRHTLEDYRNHCSLLHCLEQACFLMTKI